MLGLDLLTEIFGTKAKVAVLRTLTFSSGIPARQVQSRSGKSWGAVKQTIDSLLKTGVLTVRKGQWNDEVFLNPGHCLYVPIKNLFQAEKDFLKVIAAELFKHFAEYGLDLLSCYVAPDSNIIYLICKYLNSEDLIPQLRKLVQTLGLPSEFSVEIVDSEKFSSIWHRSDDFVLLYGEMFPYRGVERAFEFFDINDNAVLLNTLTD